MKMFLGLLLVFLTVTYVCTPAQARSDYRITWTAVPDAVKYLVFYEEKTTATGFQLLDNMDYLDPVNVSALKVFETATLSYTARLLNDSRYVVAGVVAVDVSGFYSDMGVSVITQKGKRPGKPGTVTFIKN